MDREWNFGGNFCGGAGGLYSPQLVSAMRSKGWPRPEYTYATYSYEFGILTVARSVGGQLVHHPEFHSQPPNHYRSRDDTHTRDDVREVDEGSGAPISWHYVDHEHQSQPENHRFNCRRAGCPALYTALYQKLRADPAASFYASPRLHLW